MELTLDTEETLAKSKPCKANVKIKKLDSNFSTKSRLCLKLDPKEHFWRLSNQETSELDFSEVTDMSLDIKIICTASGIVNMPLVTLCRVSEVKPSEEKGLTELVTEFEPGEIEYLACGRIVTVGDSIPEVTEV